MSCAALRSRSAGIGIEVKRRGQGAQSLTSEVVFGAGVYFNIFPKEPSKFQMHLALNIAS